MWQYVTWLGKSLSGSTLVTSGDTHHARDDRVVTRENVVELYLNVDHTIMNPTPSISSGSTPEREALLSTAQSLHSRLDTARLRILQDVAEFNSTELDQDASDAENIEHRDPAIVAADVGAQLVSAKRCHNLFISFTSVCLSHFCGNSNSSIWNKTRRINMSNPS